MTEPVLPEDAPDDEDLAELGALDRSNRIGRTAVQVGTPAAIVAVGTWLARIIGIDLDPGPGVDMPAEIVAAWVSLFAVGLAYGMNRPRH